MCIRWVDLLRPTFIDMRGITEERLIEIRAHFAEMLRIPEACLIDDLIQNECKELSEWKSIDTTHNNESSHVFYPSDHWKQDSPDK
jgi:hypothetical protein